MFSLEKAKRGPEKPKDKTDGLFVSALGAASRDSSDPSLLSIQLDPAGCSRVHASFPVPPPAMRRGPDLRTNPPVHPHPSPMVRIGSSFRTPQRLPENADRDADSRIPFPSESVRDSRFIQTERDSQGAGTGSDIL